MCEARCLREADDGGAGLAIELTVGFCCWTRVYVDDVVARSGCVDGDAVAVGSAGG